MPDRATYFLSDAHLGAASPELEAAREARLHGFLDSLAGTASALYIVGDLFDFWFEYATVIPRRYFGTLARLRRLREAGVEVVYLNGNHDFWLGEFMHETLDLRTHDGPLSLDLPGHRVWLHHGDGLIGGDHGYKLLKRLLRSPACIRLYQGLHPDLGIPLARRVSHWSRGSREERAFDPERLWTEIALPRFAAGYDTVMIGHFHQVYERRDGGRQFFVLGDWIRHFTYVVFRGGQFQLEVWPER
jgi:UDP-2,3-diacylglucosamine hydrolase